ncbi:MAG: hypothetical protein NUV46_03730 [Nanoarchaeota archaeon]|nr:hypothetical protein [Nanoarchaeota archaeon]
MVKKTLTTGELLYGLVSVFWGIPSIDEVLAGEILRLSEGGIQIIFGIIFSIISVLGVYALFDGLCRIFSDKTGVKVIGSVYNNIQKII